MQESTKDIIFDRQADGIAREAFIKGENKRPDHEIIQRAKDLPTQIGALLMRHEGVCFAIYGENVLVALLIHGFGAAGLLNLLEQGAIKFWLQKHGVMHFTAPMPKGVFPLAPYAASTPSHTDPEASIADYFRRSSLPLEYRLRRRLTRALVDAYVDAGTSFAPNAVKFGHEGYNLGRFRFAGLDPELPLTDLDAKGVETLAKLASEMHDLSLISNLHLNTLDEFNIAQVCHDSVDRLHRGGRIKNAHHEVFSIEQVPDVAELLRSGALDLKDVPTLRTTRDAEKFRAWVRHATADPHGQDVGKAYLDALAGKHGFSATVGGRVLKTLTVSALSAGAGAVLAGPAGAALGATLGPPAASVGFDIFDEFVLSGVLSGWTPRNYFEKVIFPKSR
jgi:hypothetical protein